MRNQNRLVILNGSYHRDGLTSKCLEEVAKRICLDNFIDQKDVSRVFIDDNIRSCVGCGPGKCVGGCTFKDQFQEIAREVDKARYVLIGSPVYLDMPTAKLTALLHRFNCYAENTGREYFRDKLVFIHANGYCSGTKSVIKTIMGACEMLGFSVDGRASTEYVELWKDKKIRGGRSQRGCWLGT
jgi:multimeric flavodoxin WrbA